MFTIGETVGLIEWIIDDTCLVHIVVEESALLRCLTVKEQEKWINNRQDMVHKLEKNSVKLFRKIYYPYCLTFQKIVY